MKTLTLQDLEEKIQINDETLSLSDMINTFNTIITSYTGEENIPNIEIYATRCLYLFFYLKEKGDISWEELKL